MANAFRGCMKLSKYYAERNQPKYFSQFYTKDKYIFFIPPLVIQMCDLILEFTTALMQYGLAYLKLSKRKQFKC